MTYALIFFFKYVIGIYNMYLDNLEYLYLIVFMIGLELLNFAIDKR